MHLTVPACAFLATERLVLYVNTAETAFVCYHRGPLLRDDEARERERERDGVAATRVRLDDDEVVGRAVLLIDVVDVCVGVADTETEADTLVVALEDDVCESVLEGVTLRDLDADFVRVGELERVREREGAGGRDLDRVRVREREARERV